MRFAFAFFSYILPQFIYVVVSFTSINACYISCLKVKLKERERERQRKKTNERIEEDCLILMAGIDAAICVYICPFSFLLSVDCWRRYAFVLMPVRRMCQKKTNKFSSTLVDKTGKKKENYSMSIMARK